MRRRGGAARPPPEPRAFPSDASYWPRVEPIRRQGAWPPPIGGGGGAAKSRPALGRAPGPPDRGRDAGGSGPSLEVRDAYGGGAVSEFFVFINELWFCNMLIIVEVG